MPLKSILNNTSTNVGFLLITILVVSFKLYKTTKENEVLERKLREENTLHHYQISEILKRYDSVNQNFTSHEKKSVSDIKQASDSKNEALLSAPKMKRYDAKEVKKPLSKRLKAVNIDVRGVRIVSDDVFETNSSSKIDQVRICFTLEGNTSINSGPKQIYLQILNPKKRFIALENKQQSRLKKEIFYDSLKTDACVFVDLYQHELIAGDYIINLVHEGKIIGTSVFPVN